MSDSPWTTSTGFAGHGTSWKSASAPSGRWTCSLRPCWPGSRRYDALIEDLAQSKLDRPGALHRIEEIQRALADETEEQTPRLRLWRERVGEARELLDRHGDPDRAARLAAFGRRARGVEGGREAFPTGDAATPGDIGGHHEGDEGASRRETILAASFAGFHGAGYHDAFVAYQAVAREHLEHDRIPDGHRFYVRRYFQLIRPRE